MTDQSSRLVLEPQSREKEPAHSFLLRLSDRLWSLPDPRGIMSAAAEMLARRTGMARVDYCLLLDGEDSFAPEATFSDGRLPGAPSVSVLLSGRHPDWRSTLRAGQEIFWTGSAAGPGVPVRAVSAVPLIQQGRLVALLASMDTSPREWTEPERWLHREVAERAWAAAERARAEAALLASEEKYRALFNSLDEGYFLAAVVFDEQGRAVDLAYLEANPAAARILGYDRTGRRLSEINRAYEPYWYEAFGRVARTGISERLESYAAPDRRWYDVYLMKAAGGDDARIAITFKDITARKRAEEALRESEARQAFLLKLTDTLRPLADPLEIQFEAARAFGERLGANRAGYAECVGDDGAVVIARHYCDGLAAVDGHYRLAAFGSTRLADLLSGRTVVKEDIRQDAGLTEAEKAACAALPLGAMADVPLVKAGRLEAVLFVHYAGAHTFTTGELELMEAVAERTWAAVERARAEARMRQSVELYQQQLRIFDGIVSSTPDFVYLFDLQGRFVYANRRLLEVWGVPLAGAIGKTCRELGYEQWHHDMHMREIAQVIATKRPIKGEVPFKAPLTGIFGIYEYIFTPVLGPDGEVELVAGTTRDVTERKDAEDALRQNEIDARRRLAEIEAIYESAPVGLALLDANGRFLRVNGRFAGMNGWPVEAHTGKTPGDLNPDLAGAAEAALRRILESGQPLLNLEVKGITAARPGVERIWDEHWTPVRNESGEIVAVVVTAEEVTEARRAEERLRQTQKLESIGLLAGGIAHDFNNILTGIIGNASIALDEVDDRVAERIREVMSGAERAANLTRQLLAYSGKGIVVAREIDASEAANEIGALVEFSLPKSVQLALHVQRRLPVVRMDPSQLQQVLMNLVINGGEAIGEGKPGRVTVSTTLEDVKTPLADALGDELPPGRYVSIEVSDTGCGMDAHHRAKIFDPFFTTKFTGRGLGLAAVAGIVRSYKGAITVESAPGRGSTFRVFLPAADRQPAAEPDAAPHAAVLVVDDEPTVRNFIRTALQRQGYRVLMASDGQEALAVCDRENGSVDAIILDVVMPLMGANEVLPMLRRRRPNAKILLTSGYNEAEARRLCAAHPGAAFIQKPYTAQQIAAAIAGLLS